MTWTMSSSPPSINCRPSSSMREVTAVHAHGSGRSDRIQFEEDDPDRTLVA